MNKLVLALILFLRMAPFGLRPCARTRLETTSCAQIEKCVAVLTLDDQVDGILRQTQAHFRGVEPCGTPVTSNAIISYHQTAHSTLVGFPRANPWICCTGLVLISHGVLYIIFISFSPNDIMHIRCPFTSSFSSPSSVHASIITEKKTKTHAHVKQLHTVPPS